MRIKVSGTEEQMEAFLDNFNKALPYEYGLAVKGLFDVNELCRRMIPIYKKYFTKDELNDMIKFYKSKTGRKLKDLGPTLVKEGGDIGQQYVQEKIAAIQQLR